MLDKCVFKLLRDFAVEEIFSYESLKSRKQRIFFPMSYIQGQVWEAKEVVESARAGLSPHKGDVRKKRKKRKRPRKVVSPQEGDMRKTRKKRKEKNQGRRECGSSEGKVPCALNQEFLFFGSQVFGF
jgi:hypothetical protein